MSQTYTVVGVTEFKGKFKVRFANDLDRRVKILSKEGHKNVELVVLPKPMTKQPAVAFLMAQKQFTGAAREAIERANAKYNGGNTVKVKAKNVKVKAKEEAKAVAAPEVKAEDQVA